MLAMDLSTPLDMQFSLMDDRPQCLLFNTGLALLSMHMVNYCQPSLICQHAIFEGGLASGQDPQFVRTPVW